MANKTSTKATLVSHTHWDRAWYLTFEQYRYKLIQMIDRIIELLNNDDNFKCFVLDGQTVLIEDYLDLRPENKSVLKDLITNQKLIIGPWYVLPDLFLVSGESVIRNLQVGHQMAAEFGGKLDVGYVPDPFGHFSQLPQLLNGFGIDSFIFMRGMPPEVDEKKSLLFNWVAPDGSSVLSYNTKDGYLNATNLGYEKEIGRYDLVNPDFDKAKERVLKTVTNLSDFYPNDLILLNNGIDHMPEQPEIPAIIDYLNSNFDDISITHGSFADFMTEAKTKGSDIDYSGDLLGNRDHPILLSVYSTRTYLKQKNQHAQYMLEKIAEPASIIKKELTGTDICKPVLKQAWKTLLKNHPHDDICGCSADGVHDDNEVGFRHVKEQGENIFLDTLEELTKSGFSSMNMPSNDLRFRDVFLFNPHPFTQEKWIETSVVFPNYEGEEEEILPAKLLKAIDSNGDGLEIQVIDTQAPYLKAEFVQFTWGRKYNIRVKTELPPLGYEIIRIQETEEQLISNEHQNDDHQLFENKRYALQVFDNKLTVTDKFLGTIFKNFLTFEYTQDDGDTYSYSKASEEIYSTLTRILPGKHEQSLIAYFQLKVPSDLTGNHTVDIQISVKIDLSDNEGIGLEVQYENKAKNGRLRILLPVGFNSNKTIADGHFALKSHLKRDSQNPEENHNIYTPYPGELTYTTNFQGDFCIAEGENFNSWVANRGLNEYELIDFKGSSFFAVTLHRAVGYLSVSNGKIRRPHAGPKIETPGAQCLRNMSFNLNWGTTEHDIPKISVLATAFSLPIFTRELPVFYEAPLDGELPRRKEFLSINDNRIRLSAFKFATDSDDIIIRVFNLSGEKINSELKLGIDKSEYCCTNLLEDWDNSNSKKIQNSIITFSVKPHQILTFRLRN